MTDAREKAIEAVAKGIHGCLFPDLRVKADWPALTDEQRAHYRRVAEIVIDGEWAAMFEAGWKMTPPSSPEMVERFKEWLPVINEPNTIELALADTWDAAPLPGNND